MQLLCRLLCGAPVPPPSAAPARARLVSLGLGDETISRQRRTLAREAPPALVGPGKAMAVYLQRTSPQHSLCQTSGASPWGGGPPGCGVQKEPRGCRGRSRAGFSLVGSRGRGGGCRRP